MVNRALADLKADIRDALVLRYRGLSLREIGTILGINNRATVGSKIHRGRKLLAVRLRACGVTKS